jgi:FAD/FMN-containing dehydrogenase
MFTTLGGCAAANVHGKNNWKHGPIGEHILGFNLVTPAGSEMEVTADSDPDLFHAAIGGFGWLGTFSSLTLQMKRVHSGRVEVHPFACTDLDDMFATFEHCIADGLDYVVGWIDGFAGGSRLGRGQVHAARHLQPGEDPEGNATLSLDAQGLPPRILGLIPRAWVWRMMRPFANRWGVAFINLCRYLAKTLPSARRPELQSHARFNFLLDYVPDWKRIYEPGGLIQYQFFLPRDRAKDVFREALDLSRREKLEPWLVVMKRHRPDPFWLTHALDGYSLACDYPVTDRNRGRLLDLTAAFSRMVVGAGGRFYFAKDSVLDGDSVRASLGDEVLQRFFVLKKRHDPEGLISSNLFRRVFGAHPGSSLRA